MEADNDLIKYIEEVRSRGQSDDAIRSALIAAGWDSVAINVALDSTARSPVATPSPTVISPLPTHAIPTQTKGNFWAGITIWANIAIVIFIYTLVYLGANFAIQNSRAILAFANPLVIVALTVLAVWLGVRSVLRKTAISTQNVLLVSFYAILITAISEGIIVIASFSLGSGNWWSVGAYVVQDAFIVTLVFYFLSKTSRARSIVLIIGVVFLATSIAQGYTAYWQTTSATKLAASLQNTESQISNGGTKIETQTTYKNKGLNFEMTIPAGWYVAEEDTSTVLAKVDLWDCPWITCSASLEINSNGTDFSSLADDVGSQLSRIKSDVKDGTALSYHELDNLVPGAVTLKESYDPSNSLWQYSYLVIWPYRYAMADGTYQTSTFTLFIWASNDRVTETLLPSLAIYGTPQ